MVNPTGKTILIRYQLMLSAAMIGRAQIAGMNCDFGIGWTLDAMQTKTAASATHGNRYLAMAFGDPRSMSPSSTAQITGTATVDGLASSAVTKIALASAYRP